MKKILITGAAGFIGSHLSRALLEKGYAVVGVDNLSPYYDARLKHKRLALLKKYKNFRFVKLDISDAKKFLGLVAREKPADIVHLAAQAGVRYGLTDPGTYAQANYLGTLSVFEAARHCKIPRVIYASSSSVYGGNDTYPFRESDRTDKPLSLYAATKRANELLAHAYHHLFGTELIGLRFFTVYGPWGRPDMAYFKFAKLIASGKEIEIYNQGNMARSFTYIDDIVDAMARLIEKKSAGKNSVYNLGGDQVVPLMHFVELVEKALGKKAKKKFLPMQLGDVRETAADCSLAARDFGYVPRVSIEEGIARFGEWFRENEKFVLSLKTARG